MSEVKLTIRESTIEDWYVIERAEHHGRMWLEPLPGGGMALRYSGRFSDADIEGSAAEMRAIAKAIRDRTSVSFRRCAVVANAGDTVEFSSPRNSMRPGITTLAAALDLARKIEELLG